MTKLERTTAELYLELEEDRRSNADFEDALHDQMLSGNITVQEALERLWEHLIKDEEDGTPANVEDDDAVGSNDARI